jgi:Sec7-like guanine-nucleotide exchange factor
MVKSRSLSTYIGPAVFQSLRNFFNKSFHNMTDAEIFQVLLQQLALLPSVAMPLTDQFTNQQVPPFVKECPIDVVVVLKYL